MMPIFNKNSYVVFDLDDTLYNEIDFLNSAYKQIAKLINPAIENIIYNDLKGWYKEGLNPFNQLIEKYQTKLNLNQLLDVYRFHQPQISIHNGAFDFIQWLIKQEIPIGIITDGRSVTQRNKLESLQITELFTDIIISEEIGSEKPNENNYLYFVNKYPNKNFTYIGDNTSKDFVTPNQMKWITICILNNGKNIHIQDFKKDKIYLPQIKINNLIDLII
jgi:putative hydrolase of the HAD superfamily